MRGHRCAVCDSPGVPVFRFACPRCFKAMPAPMRKQTATAWKFRMVERAAYSETVIAVLMWSRERGAVRTEEGPWEGRQ